MARNTSQLRIFWYAIATLCGLGYLPAAGTVGSLVALLVRWGVTQSYTCSLLNDGISAICLILISFVASYQVVQQSEHHDPSYIIIDEFLAMWLVLLVIPDSLEAYGIAFVWFRVFDISKWGFVSWIEQLPTVHAVMLDDLGAGVWAVALTYATVWAMTL